MNISDYLIETADQCTLIANEGRRLVARLDAMIASKTAAESARNTPPLAALTEPFAILAEGGRELSEQVDRIGKSLLAKAVEIDREREKKERSPS